MDPISSLEFSSISSSLADTFTGLLQYLPSFPFTIMLLIFDLSGRMVGVKHSYLYAPPFSSTPISNRQRTSRHDSTSTASMQRFSTPRTYKCRSACRWDLLSVVDVG